MSDDIVKIEINGQEVEARKGEMLIRVTDREGVTVPRFCYHDKLSVAANCRMCLVEVEKAPKPLPACATPVMDGMKVHTRSPKALAAQQAVMEFLLINHPLDCPICDQGGECELQDVAVGFGAGVSQYTESKRVVRDKNLGPLISSEMTRCIHCTRCVRFGEEIAGIQELGGTGRGEFMQIGTYIEKSINHELSGNVIDLCPVGALTNKPFRFRARAWEMSSADIIAPHDGVGSNLFVHRQRGMVLRAVPKANEPVNETWISDRDRYSHAGIYADDRALNPEVKGANGNWQVQEWETALSMVVERLRAATGGDFTQLGVIASPNATLEEHFLLAELARKLGCSNVDHRIHQQDFSDAAGDPAYPSLGQEVGALAGNKAILVIGADLRADAPLIAHRVRMAAMNGASVSFINPARFEYLFPVHSQQVVAPGDMAAALSAIPEGVQAALREGPSTILLGRMAFAHPQFSVLRKLAAALAETTGATLAFLPEGGNAAGAWLAGMVPHRTAGGKKAAVNGMDVQAMLDKPRKAYLVLGIEPELDALDGHRMLGVLKQAETIVLNPFATKRMRDYANVILPVGTWMETAGTFVNAAGFRQSWAGAANPIGESRPAWKVLRVLGNLFGLDGFDYEDIASVRAQIEHDTANVAPGSVSGDAAAKGSAPSGLQVVPASRLYGSDMIVRRASALQQTEIAKQARVARIHPATGQELGLKDGGNIIIRTASGNVLVPVVFDDAIAASTLWAPQGAPVCGEISVEVAEA